MRSIEETDTDAPGTLPEDDDIRDDLVLEKEFSPRRCLIISFIFFAGCASCIVLNVLISTNYVNWARVHTGIFDPECTEPLEDPAEQHFTLDLTFGKFSYTQAKILDVAWNTIIGQGGRLLHGWILYRCVIQRILVFVMENSTVSYRYFITLAFSQTSFETFIASIRSLRSIQDTTVFFCSLLLVYALGYTLLFSVIWSTATGYLSLSHKLYAMPDGSIIPLQTENLTLCWVLDSARLGLVSPFIELGMNFSILQSPSNHDKTPHVLFDSGLDRPVGFEYTLGGWRTNYTTTIWEQFTATHDSWTIQNTSDNFQNIRDYALSKQLMQMSFDPVGWILHGTQADIATRDAEQDPTFDSWWRNTTNPTTRGVLFNEVKVLQFLPSDQSHYWQQSKDVENIFEPANWTVMRLDESVRSGPGIVPYNSTIWLNNTPTEIPAPFLDLGYNCSTDSVFTSLGNCVCYRGEPIDPSLLISDNALCVTAPGYVWGFSSYLTCLGLGLEAAWMACCGVAYLWISLRSRLLRSERVVTAGCVRYALDFSESVQNNIGHDTAYLTEKELKKRLKGRTIGYHADQDKDAGALRHRIVTRKREVGKYRPTDLEVYEDLNYRLYER